jgi:hypothetical protein
VLIEALSRDGFTILHVAGKRRNRVDPALVTRPYKIKGKTKAKGAGR